MTMKTSPIVLGLFLAGLSACDNKQAQMLVVRQEFSQQLAAKDKVIDQLQQQVANLQQELGKSAQQSQSASPEQVARAVADTLAAQNAASNTEVRGKLDAILAKLAAGTPALPSADPTRTQPPAGTKEPAAREGANGRTKIRMDFNQPQ